MSDQQMLIQGNPGRTRIKLSKDGNKQVKIQEEVRLLNILVFEKIWNAYEVVRDFAES